MPKIEEEVEIELEIAVPKMYRVILHNDNYTSMDFVIMILTSIFHKNFDDAEALMIAIHDKGKAICGVYSYEIAETKAHQVITLAKQNEFPLLATIEEDM